MHSHASAPRTIEPTDTSVNRDKLRGQTHWIFLAIIALEGLFGDIYFPKWRLAVFATTLPAGFLIAVLKKIRWKAGFWSLLVGFTFLFWILNARLRLWMNGAGLLSVVIVGCTEMIALAAVVVRVYPEAKKY